MLVSRLLIALHWLLVVGFGFGAAEFRDAIPVKITVIDENGRVLGHTRRQSEWTRHHLDKLQVRVEEKNGPRKWTLDLTLNKRLIPDAYFERSQSKKVRLKCIKPVLVVKTLK